MNQISSRLSVCGSSLLRKNVLIRWSSSSKPISSSSPSSYLISKVHQHKFNNPSLHPKIPGNHHFRKFSGEATDCNVVDDDFLENEIKKIQDEELDIRCHYRPPLDAIKDLADKFNALMEKFGLPTLDDTEKEAGHDDDDYPDHLQRFRKEIQELVESIEMAVAYGEFVAAGGDDRWDFFEENYECMLNYHEIIASLKQMKIRSRLMRELLGYPPPSQTPGDRQSDDEEIDEDDDDVIDEDDDDEIDGVDYEDMTVAFEEYFAAGGGGGWQPFMGNYRCMIKYDEILASLRQMKIRSRLMRQLIKATSDSKSTVV